MDGGIWHDYRNGKAEEVVRTVCTNPVLIAVVIGLVIYLCQIPVPEVIEQPLALIGNMNTPLSMIITGMMIAGSNLAQMLATGAFYLWWESACC